MTDEEMKAMFGRMLGEIYRVEKKLDVSKKPDCVIYGLLNGIESAIDAQIPELISKAKEAALSNILQEYHEDKTKRDALKGYYDIESKVEKSGISRAEAIALIKIFKYQGRFGDTLAKFDTEFSPVECRTFPMDKLD